MLKPQRYIISYIIDNQPESIELLSDSENFNEEDARQQIEASLNSEAPANITDIRIIGLYHPTNPDVHPGHFQQPEG